MTVWLLFLPAAVLVMGLAAYTLLRDGPRARSSQQRHACAATGCRLAVLSSLLLALAGLGCLDGTASALGWAMIVLGLSGATAAHLFFRRYLAEPRRQSSRRHRSNHSVQWTDEDQYR